MGAGIAQRRKGLVNFIGLNDAFHHLVMCLFFWR
jgi:hypothetical protein